MFNDNIFIKKTFFIGMMMFSLPIIGMNIESKIGSLNDRINDVENKFNIFENNVEKKFNDITFKLNHIIDLLSKPESSMFSKRSSRHESRILMGQKIIFKKEIKDDNDSSESKTSRSCPNLSYLDTINEEKTGDISSNKDEIGGDLYNKETYNRKTRSADDISNNISNNVSNGQKIKVHTGGKTKSLKESQ